MSSLLQVDDSAARPQEKIPRFIPYIAIAVGFSLIDVSLSVIVLLASDAAYSLVSDVPRRPEMAVQIGLFAGILSVAVVHLSRGYILGMLCDPRRSARLFLRAWLSAFFIIGWVGFLTQSTEIASRATVTFAFIAGLAFIVPLRLGASQMLKTHIRSQRIAASRVIVVYDSEGNALEDIRRRLGEDGIYVCAVFSFSSEAEALCEVYSDLVAQCRATIAKDGVDAIYLYASLTNRANWRCLQQELGKLPVGVELIVNEEFSELLSRPHTDSHGGVRFEIQRPPLDRWERVQKRALDLFVAGLMLLMFLPLMLLIALAIKLESSGPVFFRQTRRGFSGRQFEVFKFRSMKVMENGPVVTQASRQDPRVTSLGRFIRRSSLDELPQLINVIRGEMSLVGPRPHAVAHDDYYEKLIATYASRNHVKPGLTGWAQVNGHRGATPEVKHMENRVAHDLWYIERWSIWLDFRIIAATILVIFRDDQAF